MVAKIWLSAVKAAHNSYRKSQFIKACVLLKHFYLFKEHTPHPPATPAEQAPIIALVEQVLAAKSVGEPTAALEAEIDTLVAARYGLTPAEAAQLG